MNKIEKRSAEIIKSFSHFSSWEERYKQIIHIGKITPPLKEQHKTKEWLVKGCQSQVWLYAYQDEMGRVIFRADSDALITKGLISLLLQYYSELLPKEIMSYPVPSFFEALDLKNHLTPTRVGGLDSMLRQIQYYAKAFYLKDNLKKN